MTATEVLFDAYINGDIACDKEKQDKLAAMQMKILKVSKEAGNIEGQISDFLYEALRTGFMAGTEIAKEIFLEK